MTRKQLDLVYHLRTAKKISVNAFLVLVIFHFGVGGALGQKTETYDKEAKFRLQPGGTVVPIVTEWYYCHSWARDPILRGEDFAPNQAGVGVFPGGFDRLVGQGVRNRPRAGAGIPVEVNLGSNVVPAAGTGAGGDLFGALTHPPSNSANGFSFFSVDPFAAGGAVTGRIGVFGSATAVPLPVGPSEAYASSYARLTAQGGRVLRNGNIRWEPDIKTTKPLFGQAYAHFLDDPIVATVTDLTTGQSIQSTLLEIQAITTEGGLTWNSSTGVFQSELWNGSFRLVMNSPFTSLQGLIEFSVENGIVIASQATGDFAGFATPAIGSSGTFSASLGLIDFNYDLGNFDGHDLDVALDFSAMGEAFVSVPEPSALVLLSLGTLGGFSCLYVRRRLNLQRCQRAK